MARAATNDIRGSIARVALVTACILLVPRIAMEFTDEVVWTIGDFVVAGVLLFSAGVTYALVARRMVHRGSRAAVAAAVIAALVLVWVQLI